MDRLDVEERTMTLRGINPNLRLISIAKRFLGVREDGENQGPEVELFQKAVDGKASGEPWCCCFVQHVVKQAEHDLLLTTTLHRSESVLETWKKSQTLRMEKPMPGDLMCWQIPGTEKGHIGIVRELHSDGLLEVIEGNTNLAGSREGEGVYAKVRSRMGSPRFLALGWLRVFPSLI